MGIMASIILLQQTNKIFSHFVVLIRIKILQLNNVNDVLF